MPDPTRAHGAWVYLGLASVAGVGLVEGTGRLAALSVGLLFVAGLVAASALCSRNRGRRWNRWSLAFVLVVPSAIGIGSLVESPAVLSVAAFAIVPAALAVLAAERFGFQSAPTLTMAVMTLVIAAPMGAAAGGAPIGPSMALWMGLAPFFAARAWQLRRRLAGRSRWSRSALRRQGWLEAAYATLWTAAVVTFANLATSALT